MMSAEEEEKGSERVLTGSWECWPCYVSPVQTAWQRQEATHLGSGAECLERDDGNLCCS